MSYQLTYKEILLLLQSAGVESINGIYIEEDPVSDEEIVLLIDGLVKKGVLCAEDDSFRMEKTVGRMIRCMGWPEKDYRAPVDGEDAYCYERGEDLLVTRPSQTRERTLEMELRRTPKKEETII